MSSHVAWNDIRAEHVARAGGEDAVEAGKREMLAEVIGHRLAEVRRARGLTRRQVADRMGVTKGRISQIERGKISGHDVLARYATALGGRLHPAIYFDDGDIRHCIVEPTHQRSAKRPMCGRCANRGTEPPHEQLPVTRARGAAGLAVAFKLVEAAQDRWRAVNGPHLVALVHASVTFAPTTCSTT
jgi:DNA-binding XRE family transcriptional regulator